MKRLRCEKGMSVKFPDMEKHLQTEFLGLKKQTNKQTKKQDINKWWYVYKGSKLSKNITIQTKSSFSDIKFRVFL